ncbi:uncharacterized protein [Periplaneta americana]|uniref:uncharacterized protein n=1 Tax=Periplaneta americana TaxID=6978 RepID=UPI0037E91DBD
MTQPRNQQELWSEQDDGILRGVLQAWEQHSVEYHTHLCDGSNHTTVCSHPWEGEAETTTTTCYPGCPEFYRCLGEYMARTGQHRCCSAGWRPQHPIALPSTARSAMGWRMWRRAGCTEHQRPCSYTCYTLARTAHTFLENVLCA